MQGEDRVFSIKSAMQRRLSDLNVKSLFSENGLDTAKQRLHLEISIRKLEGINQVRYWLLPLEQDRVLDFKRSLKSWLGNHRQYSFAVSILTNLDTNDIYLEAPLQLEVSLDSWLQNYWGMENPKIKNHLEFDRVAYMARFKMI